MWMMQHVPSDFGVQYEGFFGFFESLGAILVQFWYTIVTVLVKVAGYFADMMNIAFYIFAGVDINSTKDGVSNIYDISVHGEKKNILDYFVFSDTMQKAYFWLALLGLLLVVIFTIYRIIKQDYFDRAGPRSKGPIFRNVAISCISFLLVIPIFYLIIHASSLLAVVVMDAMGMDASQFAGAKVFQLSWSDNGEMVKYINGALTGSGYKSLKLVDSLHGQTLFTILANGKHVEKSGGIMYSLGLAKWSAADEIYTDIKPWSGRLAIIDSAGQTMDPPTFYWYLYFIGIIITIKSMYTLLLAMMQRIFKLMALFLVAPSPISQYVLDDGQKYKSWLAQSIQEGLRLVVAVMSFSIYLIVLNLVGNIDFVSAFKTASGIDSIQQINVTTGLLETGNELKDSIYEGIQYVGGVVTNTWENMVNAFMHIFLLIGAGGAIIDLDQVLSPLISGAKSSLNAEQTGKSAGALVSAVGNVASTAAGGIVGSIGSDIANAWKNRGAGKLAREEGRNAAEKDIKDATAKPEEGTNGVKGSTGTGGGTGGGGGGGDSPKGTDAGDTSTAEVAETVEEAKGDTDTSDATGDADKETAEVETDAEGKDPESEEAAEAETAETEGDEGDTKPPETPKERKARKKAEKKAAEKAERKAKRRALIRRMPRNAARFAEDSIRAIGSGTLDTLRSVGGGVFNGIKAGFASAGRELLAAVVGKDAAKAFLDAKKDVATKRDAVNQDRAKRKYGKDGQIAAREYARTMEDKIDAAIEESKTHAADVDTASAELTEAVKEENKAAEALGAAESKARGDAAVATDATTDVKSEQMAKLNQKIAEQEGIINGTHVPSTGGRVVKATEGKVPTEAQKERARAKLEELKAKKKSTSEFIDVMADSSQEMTKLGITGKTFAEAKAQVLANPKASKRLREAFEHGDQRYAKSIYEASAYARCMNEKAHVSATAAGEAKKTYNAAHAETEAARSRVTTSMEAYNKSVKLAKNISEKAQKSAHLGTVSKVAYDDKGNIVRNKGTGSRNRLSRKERKNLAKMVDNDKLDARTEQTRLSADRALSIARVNPYDSVTVDEAVKTVTEHMDARKAKVTEDQNKLTEKFEEKVGGMSGKVKVWDASKVVGGAVSDDGDVNYKKIDRLASSKRASDAFREDLAKRKRESQKAAGMDDFNTRVVGGLSADMQEKLRATMKDGSYDFDALDKIVGEIDGKSPGFAGDYQTFKRASNEKFVNGGFKVDDKPQGTLTEMFDKHSETTVGEFAGRYKTSEGHYDTKSMARDLRTSPSKGSELHNEVTSYNTQSDSNAMESRQIDTSARAIQSLGEYKGSLDTRGASILRQYSETVPQVQTLTRIIDSGGTIELDDSTRKMIGAAIGSPKGYYRGNNPEDIVKAATDARNIKYAEQETLIREGEHVAKEKATAAEQLTIALGTALEGLDGSKKETTKNEQHIHYHNDSHTHTDSGESSRPFFRDYDYRPGSTSAADESNRMRDIYDKMQTDGLSHLESILGQVKIRVDEVERIVEEVERTVKEDDE